MNSGRSGSTGTATAVGPTVAGIFDAAQGTVQTTDLVHEQEGQDEVSQGNAAHEGERGLAGEDAGSVIVSRGIQLDMLLPEGTAAARRRARGSD